MWTKNNKPGSHLIRWGLDAPVSHFACAFFANKEKGLVVHQKFEGFTVDWLPKWRKDNDIIYHLEPIAKDRDLDRRILHGIMDNFSGTEYDMTGLAYFSWRAFLYKFFNKKLPDKNKWSNAKEPICTGVAKTINDISPEWFSSPVEDFDILPPHQLYLNMSYTGLFKPSTLFTGD